MSLFRNLKYFRGSASLSLSDSNADKNCPGQSVLTGDRLLKTREILERILKKNIIPFWYPGVIDEREGGYRLNHDIKGRWRGPAKKSVVSQARVTWFFSRLATSKYGNTEHLKAATHGYEFLRDCMWDERFGGFYWEMDSSGHSATERDKRLYGQAFGLYALTEYAIASGDPTAMAKAKELFVLIETNAHDVVYGGYPEALRGDWAPWSPEAIRTATPAAKTMNTHIHLLEAFTRFYALTHEPMARERLLELIVVNSSYVVRKNVGACTDKYLENWEPLQGTAHDRVSYGHDVENIWLLIEACENAGIHKRLWADLYRTLFYNALQYGFDWSKGGFYESGPLGAPADRREKIWWVQAEGLLAALQMYRLTGEENYLTVFLRILGWIVHHQADWRHGDWYATVSQDGKVSGAKAGPWKAPYHNGRAMLRCLELLAETDENQSHETST